MKEQVGWRERGAAAVEFAILFPLLILLIAGIIDMGRLLFGQIMLTNAAREGARMVAMGQSAVNAEARAVASMPMFTELVNDESPAQFNPGPACAPGGVAQVTVSATDFDWVMLGFTGLAPPQPSATATMRCGG
ncbi:hypothetical protein GCM10023168_26190 [Fodinibacter luteus]|uniref:TadE-like domain-containing protein n=1 Tax=Fodinibacter luteus TaxID=552064 RepID=A0ABP8KKQ9_9MICO